jgi:Flp pilus assembly protein TadB
MVTSNSAQRFVAVKFSIRQAMAITLVVALSLQGCVELIEVLSLSDSRQTREHLEAKVRPLRQQTEISELVIASLPLTSAEYVSAKERFERLMRGQGRKNGQ